MYINQSLHRWERLARRPIAAGSHDHRCRVLPPHFHLKGDRIASPPPPISLKSFLRVPIISGKHRHFSTQALRMQVSSPLTPPGTLPSRRHKPFRSPDITVVLSPQSNHHPSLAQSSSNRKIQKKSSDQSWEEINTLPAPAACNRPPFTPPVLPRSNGCKTGSLWGSLLNLCLLQTFENSCQH